MPSKQIDIKIDRNGGAGATGLISALAHDYLSTRSGNVAITWVCNHSRNTQLALLNGYIDLALTYERGSEQLAVSEGWARSAGCVFHDHFCLVGPIADPLCLRTCSTPSSALLRLAQAKHLFHSRADFSATMFKERDLWQTVGLRPWEECTNEWYKTSLMTPAEALIEADRGGAYALTDRSTLLRQTMLGTISRTTVICEPQNADDVLMNSCHALYATQAPLRTQMEVAKFLRYLLSERGQNIVAKFGEHDVGLPFFARVDEGYARSSLIGGKPQNRRWSVVSML